MLSYEAWGVCNMDCNTLDFGGDDEGLSMNEGNQTYAMQYWSYWKSVAKFPRGCSMRNMDEKEHP